MRPPTTDAEKAFEYDAAKRSLAKVGRHGGLVYELVRLFSERDERNDTTNVDPER